jgi:cytochrome c553
LNNRLVGFYTIVCVIGLALIWVGGITLSSSIQIGSRVALPALAFDARGGDTARGKHFVDSVLACTECHGADLAGAPVIKGGIGRVYAPNLTPGGVGLKLTDADFDRAIRHGVAPDGTRLFFMPSQAYSALSDADLRDVVAYLRTLPAVDRSTPPREFGFGGRMLAVTHNLPAGADRIDHSTVHPASEPPSAGAAYGKYLARISGCYQCHGPDLGGGHFEGPSDVPRAPNISPSAIGSWSLAQFGAALRDGRDPSGRKLNPFMPWHAYAGLNDDEVAALYAFLKTVPPITY